MSRFTDKINHFRKEVYYFFTSRVFIRHLLSFNLLAFGVLFLSFQGLKCHTRLGQTITVPNLTGMTMRQIEELNLQGFKIKISDSTYIANKQPLEVLSQEPQPNAKVKYKRTIYVTVNTIGKPQVKVPHIWGDQVEFATRQLADLDIVAVVVEERPDKAKGTILEVRYKGRVLQEYDPRQGSTMAPRIPKGSRLELVIASGVGMDISLPNLVCMTYQDAMFVLQAAGLSTGTVIGNVVDTANAYIWQQSPDPALGESIRVGEQISVWLSVTLPSTCSRDSAFIPTPPDELIAPEEEEAVDTEL